MCKGAFENIFFYDDLKMRDDVEEFGFCLNCLEDVDRATIELVIRREDGQELRREYLRVLPDDVLEEAKEKLSSLEGLNIDRLGRGWIIEEFPELVSGEIRDSFNLEIGKGKGGIYFSIKYKEQQVSILDLVIPRNEVLGFIREA